MQRLKEYPANGKRRIKDTLPHGTVTTLQKLVMEMKGIGSLSGYCSSSSSFY